MWSMIDAMNENIVLVISGDLCHKFDPSGPFGYSNASEPFDKVQEFNFYNNYFTPFLIQAIGQWVMEQDSNYLLEVAASLVDKCYSCGYTGFVILEGVMETAR